MNELRKAAQMALWALRHTRYINQYSLAPLPGGEIDTAVDALRAALAQPEPEPYPLPDSLYPDSKDWAAADYASRVEWLHFMYEAKKREVAQLETTLLRAALAQPEQLVVGGDDLPTLTKWTPQRKPLTEEEICYLWSWSMTAEAERTATTQQHAFARAIEKAHGIGGEA